MRNQFNLSHEHKTSVELGQLIPILTEEVLPGDTFIHSMSALTRVAPLLHPLMHRVELRMHSFYVPNRILWSGWEDFITGEDEVTQKPTITTDAVQGNVLDYMGIPPVAGIDVDALPIQAYNLIWNEYYRDQNLQEERLLTDTSLARCAWQKDYFTIARPQPQQGDPEAIPVTIGELPVVGLYRGDIQNAEGHTAYFPASGVGETPPPDTTGPFFTAGVFSDHEAARVFADGSQGNLSMSIDDLRRSLAVQRFAEARMRFGSRYVDYLRYIGVNPSDGRLDRPEYLGGGKEVLSFSEVLATAETAETNVGDMKGHGIGMGRAQSYTRMFEEHGWVLTLLSARPKTVYNNALPRKFTRANAMDYWQKELEVLPWQEVYQQEVDASGAADDVFGYVPRYEEYRHCLSHVSNTLRNGTENDWHLGRTFQTPPTLNASFVECTPDDRIYADAGMPDLIINVMHNLRARRFVGQTATMGTDL